jgi:hypothetical protein
VARLQWRTAGHTRPLYGIARSATLPGGTKKQQKHPGPPLTPGRRRISSRKHLTKTDSAPRSSSHTLEKWCLVFTHKQPRIEGELGAGLRAVRVGRCAVGV